MLSQNKSKFKLGKVVFTQGALAALADSNELPDPFIKKHQCGDWGNVCKEDAQANEDAIENEGNIDKQMRVMSVYKTSRNETIWLITEWTREVTTLLLPSEY